MRRTVPIKLDVDSNDAALLQATVDQFKRAANLVVDDCRDDDGGGEGDSVVDRIDDTDQRL